GWPPATGRPCLPHRPRTDADFSIRPDTDRGFRYGNWWPAAPVAAVYADWRLRRAAGLVADFWSGWLRSAVDRPVGAHPSCRNDRGAGQGGCPWRLAARCP